MGVATDSLAYAAKSITIQSSTAATVSLTVTAPSQGKMIQNIYLDDLTISANVTVTSAAEWQVQDGSTIIDRGWLPASTNVAPPFVKVYAHARKITVSNNLTVSCPSIGNTGIVDIAVGYHITGS